MAVTVYADTINEYLVILDWLRDNVGQYDGWHTDYSEMSSVPGARDWGRIVFDDEEKEIWFQLIWG